MFSSRDVFDEMTVKCSIEDSKIEKIDSKLRILLLFTQPYVFLYLYGTEKKFNRMTDLLFSMQ